jgi:hypothetical protein
MKDIFRTMTKEELKRADKKIKKEVKKTLEAIRKNAWMREIN